MASRTPSIVATFVLLMFGAATRANDAEYFEKKVRPVLVEHCYACHSADAKKLKAGLRLDGRGHLLIGGESGPALVPGEPAKSRIINAIGYGNVELRMPPKGKLPASAIADLTAWVKAGAPWPKDSASAAAVAKFDLAKRKAEHWAWRPIKPTVPTAVRDAVWPSGPVDRFILAKLEAGKLRPAPTAAQSTLLRRVYFDLIGLPPPVDVARSFAADPSPRAYEQIVDRLLASPQFGEHWARHWLDLVRYSETRGNEFDYINPNAWQYRDYLIRALNADVPYDKFVIEHLAGDLLAEPRRHPTQGFNESILATGCWFFGDQVHSPVDLKQDEADHLDTMIDVFSKTFLGLTVSCARCHDHKFDAISTKDYHALLGVFESSTYRQVRYETADREREIAGRLRALEQEHEPAISAELAGALRTKIEEIEVPTAAEIPAGARTLLDFRTLNQADWRPDGAAFGDGPRKVGELLPGGERVRVMTRPGAVADPAWTKLKVEGQSDPGDLGQTLRAGRTIRTPATVLDGRRLYYLVRGKGLAYAAVQNHTMIEGPLHRTLVIKLDGGDDWRWIEHDLRRYSGHRTHFEFTATGPDFAVAAVIESERHPEKTKTERVSAAEIKLAIEKFASGSLEEKNARCVDALLRRLPSEPRPAVTAFRAERARIVAELPIKSRVAPALFDGSGFDERVFIRGNPKNLGDPVPRRFLEAIVGERSLSGSGSGRLELAKQITDPSLNPFISRVMVNRVWHHLFGRGLVPSTDNFGVMGEAPTHLELLDWLADDFVRSGWSVKRLIRSLVLSSAYRMASSSDDAADPQNRLWHRAELRRLPGETIRDSILAVAGTLDPTMFGPPVPIHLTPFMEGRGKPGKSGPLDGAGRRSIYLELRRNFLHPFLMTFDQPGPGSTVGRRTVSNVPAQALVLMNDPFVHEQAAKWGKRLNEMHVSPAERVELMYWTAFARPPTEAERAACIEFVEKSSWSDLAHALWNVKEFVYLY